VQAIAALAVALEAPKRRQPDRRLIAVAVREQDGEIAEVFPKAGKAGHADIAAMPPRQFRRLSIRLLPADPVPFCHSAPVHIEPAHIEAAKHERHAFAPCRAKKSSFMGTCGTASA
jgi:hypothetical protein